MKIVNSVVAGLLAAFALTLALPAGANAANETPNSTFNLEPQSGSFYSDAFKAANWEVANTVSVPAGEPQILPSKVIDIGNPQGEMTFNPGNMPVCGNEIGPGNVSVPVDVVVARCPNSVLGNGTAQFAFAQVPTALLDGVVVAFNGGLSNGNPLVKIYAYSYDTNVGVYSEAPLTSAGRLKFDIPQLTGDSSVTTLDLAIPGERQVLSGVDPSGQDVILPKGQKADYVQAKCSNGQHPWDVEFTLGTRATDGTPTSPDTFVSDSGVESCSGSPAPPLETTITSGPSGTTSNASPNFTFSSPEPGSTFECELDGGGFSPCTSPKSYSDLAEGAHSFAVRATRPGGSAPDPSPAVRSFTVDTTPPETQIDSGPNGATDDTTPTFGFSANEPSSFECRLYLQGLTATEFTACSGPGDSHTSPGGLPEGDYVFGVRATDTAGNVDPSPATRTFTIDTTVYRAKIKKLRVRGPNKVKRKKKATYKVKIKNGGNAKAKGVRLKVKGRGVSFNTSVGKIGAKKTRTVKIRLKARKAGKVKLKFKVTSKNAGGKTVKKKIRVRK